MRDKISKMKSDQSVRLLDRASKMCNDGKISTNHFIVFEKYISDQLNFEEIANCNFLPLHVFSEA